MELFDSCKKKLRKNIQYLTFQRQSIIDNFLAYRKSDANDGGWSAKAVKVLLKKLDHSPTAIKNLEYALSHPNQPSYCVTIKRSANSMLQVKNRTERPHVAFCRIWRWPDLTSHRELESLDCCQQKFEEKLPFICINPYHFRRTNLSAIPSIRVRRIQPMPGGRANQNAAEPSFSMTPSEMPSKAQSEMPSKVSMESEIPSEIPSEMPALPSPPFSVVSPNSDHWNSGNEYSPLYQTDPPYTPESMDFATASQEIMNSSVSNPTFPPPYSCSSTNSVGRPEESQVSYEECHHWCSIVYFEENQKMASYQVLDKQITVDGFDKSDEMPNRFALGSIVSEHRHASHHPLQQPNGQSMNCFCRYFIGKGIELCYVNNEIYLQCLSQHPVYVSGPFLDDLHGTAPHTVVKIEPGHSFKLFDNQVFANLIIQSVDGGYEGVYALVKKCNLLVSFFKGWGANHPQRPHIHQCPCWISIDLNGPLQWLDRVLVQMGKPTGDITSVS